jgi:hypothetical protein
MLSAVGGPEELGSRVGSDGLINYATNSSRATWPATARQDDPRSTLKKKKKKGARNEFIQEVHVEMVADQSF